MLESCIKNSRHPAARLLLDFIFQKAIHQPKYFSDNTSYPRIHTWQSGCGSRDGEGKVNVLMPSTRTGSERAWVSPGQTEEIIHSVIVETDHSRNRWSRAKTCRVVSVLPAVALTPNPSVVSSGHFLSVIAWWSETTETWLALSRSQTLVCYTIGNRSWHESNEELFMARAGRPYPLGVSGPQGNGGQESSANTPAAICAANIGSRQRSSRLSWLNKTQTICSVGVINGNVDLFGHNLTKRRAELRTHQLPWRLTEHKLGCANQHNNKTPY